MVERSAVRVRRGHPLASRERKAREGSKIGG